MWHALPATPEARADFLSTVNELLQSTSRVLIFAVAGIYAAFIYATAVWPERLAMQVWPILPVIALTCIAAFWLLSRRFLLAQAVLQLGLGAAIVLGLHNSRQPEVILFAALLPLMAVVTLGWPAGAAVEGLVVGLVWWLTRNPAMPPLSLPLVLATVLGGACSGVLGWASARTLLTVTRWSLYSYEQAREKVEEARDQRLELKQIQEDLVKANQELARLSARLEAMYQVAEEARRAKEEFVANVSHELRTPLNMIIGFSETIVESPQIYGGDLPPALLSDIATIHANSQSLATLVNDVLDLSQVEVGRMALSKERTSLQSIIDGAALAVRPLFESRALYLEVQVPPELPTVFCDSTRIREVVLNLLSNAGRYTEEGGVQIRAWQEGAQIVVAVADTGPGIAPEDQKRLFEPFQQLDTSIRRRHRGSGLGLSISRRFIEMHGGRMWLESQVGVGTTFYFSLPLENPLPAALPGADDPRRWYNPYESTEYRLRTRRSKAPAPDASPRVVLLEEGNALCHLFERYLEDLETVAVASFEEAVVELSRSPAQALVVNLPPFRQDLAPVERLRDLPYGTPAVSCWAPGEDEAARRIGVVRYLVKPISRQTLLSALAALGDGVRSVLLVDDQPDALRLFARILSSSERSYRVLRAKSGQRALSLLRQERPDVMLLDLVMPGMDGFQVLQEKSQDPSIRDIPVITISARDPSGEPIVSDTLTVTKSGGLSVRELLGCIQALAAILSPERMGN